jgi:hypothetical protein
MYVSWGAQGQELTAYAFNRENCRLGTLFYGYLGPLCPIVSTVTILPEDQVPMLPAVSMTHWGREDRFDYFLVESAGISETLPVAAPRLGLRTALTLPLFPPPQKN